VCTACVAAVDYAYPWDRLITRFKFQGETGWARAFGDLMQAAPGADALLAEADWLLPVPLTPQRLAERGHHPPWALTQALARRGPRRSLVDGLVRLGEAPAQHRLGRQQRLHNLRGLFAAPADRLAQLRGARLLLIDDVMTTGATLDAAATALRAAGAGRVDALVFARTPAPHESLP
jgi:ComF family protein